jgi:hypothetical protein
MWQLDGNKKMSKNCKSLKYKSKFYPRNATKNILHLLNYILQQLHMLMYCYLQLATVTANAKMSFHIISGDFLKIQLPG